MEDIMLIDIMRGCENITTLIGLLIAIIILIVIFNLIIRRLIYGDNPKFFQYFVKRYERKDREMVPAPGSVVFTGSSIVQYWETIEDDLAPMYVINRGMAGAKINEVAYYVDRIVIPYYPKAVVLYAGSNDIQGANPRTPEQVFEGYKEFVSRVHSALPNIPIYYISINPSPASNRWKHWPKVIETNMMIEEFCKENKLLRFIDITEKFLDDSGQPIPEYFKNDKIHMNEKGYAVWTSVIKPILLNDLYTQQDS